MSWWKRDKPALGPTDDSNRHVRTEGLWQKCESCGQVIWRKSLEDEMRVCPKCGYHFRIDAAARLRMLLDGDWEEFDRGMTSTDPLEFSDSKSYKTRLAGMQAATSLGDAVISAGGLLNGRRVH